MEMELSPERSEFLMVIEDPFDNDLTNDQLNKITKEIEENFEGTKESCLIYFSQQQENKISAFYRAFNVIQKLAKCAPKLIGKLHELLNVILGGIDNGGGGNNFNFTGWSITTPINGLFSVTFHYDKNNQQ